MDNKNRKPLLNLLINCISSRSAPTNIVYKRLLYFFFQILKIDLCSSSANCHVGKSKRRLFGIIPLLAAPPEGFLSKILLITEAISVDFHHILDF